VVGEGLQRAPHHLNRFSKTQGGREGSERRLYPQMGEQRCKLSQGKDSGEVERDPKEDGGPARDALS